MTEYRKGWPYPVAFPEQRPATTLAEVIAESGGHQLHVAETEKYAHVTYFFNGGREEEWEGEERRLVDSPRDVDTYDLKPQMSAEAAAREFASQWSAEDFRFGIINFANPDMVGHTGVIPAAVKAVEAVDECLAEVSKARRTRYRSGDGRIALGSDNKVVMQIDRKALGIDEHCSVRIPYPGAPWFNVQTLPFGRDIVSIYMGGPISAELEAAGEDVAVEAGRQAMIDAFGTAIGGHLGVSAASAWGREPSILGAYGAARPGEANLRADLAKPVENGIFFCGEATHPHFFSTCHGAWMTGERAAAEAIAHL